MKILLFLLIIILFLTRSKIENFALSKDDIPDIIKQKMKKQKIGNTSCPIRVKHDKNMKHDEKYDKNMKHDEKYDKNMKHDEKQDEKTNSSTIINDKKNDKIIHIEKVEIIKNEDKEIMVDNTAIEKKIDNISTLIEKTNRDEMIELKKVNMGLQALQQRPIDIYPKEKSNKSNNMYIYLIIVIIILTVGGMLYILLSEDDLKNIQGPEYMEMSFEEASKIAKKNLLKKYLATLKPPETN